MKRVCMLTLALSLALVLSACSASVGMDSKSAESSGRSADNELESTVVDGEDDAGASYSHDAIVGSSFETLGFKLNDLVVDSSESVSTNLGNLASVETKVRRDEFSIDAEMISLMSNIPDIGSHYSEVNKLQDEIQRMKPWSVSVCDKDLIRYSLNDVSSGIDPVTAVYRTYRVKSGLTCEDIADVVAEAFEYDQVFIYRANGEGTALAVYGGVARLGDCISRISVAASGDVAQIQVECHNIDEDENRVSSGLTYIEAYFKYVYDGDDSVVSDLNSGYNSLIYAQSQSVDSYRR